MVRTPPPTATSGKMPPRPVRKPSSKLSRTSEPPEMMLVFGMKPTTPVISRPKPKLLRNFSEYSCSIDCGEPLNVDARWLDGSVEPCVPSFQYDLSLEMPV